MEIKQNNVERIIKDGGKHIINLLGLYILFVRASVNQGKDIPQITNEALTECLSLNIQTIRKYRTMLINMGLIEAMPRTNPGMHSGSHYKIK